MRIIGNLSPEVVFGLGTLLLGVVTFSLLYCFTDVSGVTVTVAAITSGVVSVALS